MTGTARAMAGLALALLSTACATTPAAPPVLSPAVAGSAAASDFDALPGWASENHPAALVAFRQTCAIARDPSLAAVCRAAQTLGDIDRATARAFFERNFIPVRLPGDGLLTAYFSPEFAASPTRTPVFTAPLRPRPADLVVRDGVVLRDGPAGLEPYPDRAAIETVPAEAPLAWLQAEDLFFLQIQGSGVLVMPDGRRLKAAVAATNGRPFVGLAKLMRQDALLADGDTSGESIRRWLVAHRGPQADTLMQRNPRYVFFALAPDDGVAPKGSAGVPLPAGRAVAVDPAFHAWGGLLWIDATAPALGGAFPAYRRLVTALDSGGAIKGAVRADLYLGQGSAAGVEAGRVRHGLRLWRLIPRAAGGGAP